MDLTDIIYSNDYINILIQNYVAQSERYQMLFPESSALLTLNSQYSVLFLERSLLPENLFGEILFTGLPKLFTPLSTLSLEVSGIVQTQNLYGGGYTGKNVILGFLDTGIDYRHPAFLRSNGQSRILSIWDQTDRTGTPPPQFPYGSLYEKSDLDDALRSRDPLSVVPVTDPDGHGTYVAGVAGGTPNASAGFLGAAPEADFAVVKLKPAKQNLKDFYLVSTNAPVFEEDDLLSAMRFLNEVAAREGKPLVICLALGTNQGSHSGTLPIALTLARYGNTPGIIPVCATGNEGNTAAKRGAAAALQGSRAYRQAVQTQLVATIADSYYTLAMLDAQMAISNRTLENWRTTVRTLEALKKVGKSNEAGVLQAKANVMRLEASLLSIRKSISETENALSAILAMPSHSIGRSNLAEAAFPDTVSIGVPLQLLSNRPDVRQAEMELAQAFYATNAARAAFYPNITLSGTLGWTNNGGGVIVNPGQWLLNAIGSLTQPLFNRGTNIANLKIAKSRQEEAKLLFRQSLLNAGKEVNDALTAWQTAKSQIEINARQVETLCDAVRKTESLMRHSNATYLEVLTAQQSLLEAEVQQLQTRFERIQSVIKLYHVLGGGM